MAAHSTRTAAGRKAGLAVHPRNEEIPSLVAGGTADVMVAEIVVRGRSSPPASAWIERFRLEKREGAWFFAVRLRVLAEAPDGSVAVTDAAQSVPVSAEGSRPTAAETVRAISKAIDACATMATR